MQTRYVWCICSGVLIAALAAQGATAAPTNSDEAAIRNLESQFITAFNAKDVNKIMSFYAPGNELFVFDVGTPRQHVGWADYKKDWEQLFAAYPGPLHIGMSDLAITVVGPVAYGHSIQGGYYTDKDGKRQDVMARVSDVYRKQHGKWLVVQEHVSVPIDFSTMKPDLMSKP